MVTGGISPSIGHGIHPLVPVLVVPVGDQGRYRAAHGEAVAHSGPDLDRVGLDLHATAAAVAELSPGHVPVEGFAVEFEAGGQPFNDGDQTRSVRLASGCESKTH